MYIGEKGFTIYKEELTLKEQMFLRDDLMIKPYIPNSPIKTEPYPIYRESNKKLYIPRFYGINNYGNQIDYKIQMGKDINLNFNGNLRDYQINIIEKSHIFAKVQK